MAISGLLLVGFVVAHLAGNLTLYSSSPVPFNTYAAKLQSLGPLVIAAEVGLIALFLLHIVSGILVRKGNMAARPVRYQVVKGKGGPSKGHMVPTKMAISGVLILVFLVIHVWQFKFGPGVEAGYSTALENGQNVRDLHRLVVETFRNPVWVGFYVLVMALLGLHLRHGFWSAFQSLGAATPGLTKALYCAGFIVGGLLAAGFLFIPICIYFGNF